MTVGHSTFATTFSSPEMVPNTSQNHPNASQRVPTISGRFGASGGNVKTMVSFTRNHSFGGGPETPLVQHFAYSVFQCASWNDFFSLCCRFGLPRGPGGGPTKDPQTTFFVTFPTLPPSGPLGSPGSPRHPQHHQNTSKIDSKMTPEGVKTFRKHPSMNPLAQGINRLIGPSTNSASPANATSRPIMPDIPSTLTPIRHGGWAEGKWIENK